MFLIEQGVDEKPRTKKKDADGKKLEAKGIIIREAAMRALKKENTDDNPFEGDAPEEDEIATDPEDSAGPQQTPTTRKRKMRSDVIEYLSEKNEKDDRLRLVEIRFKERKFDKEAELREKELKLQRERLEKDSKLHEEELSLKKAQLDLQREQQMEMTKLMMVILKNPAKT
ncbi:uncharacterized protein LOC135485723 [Lineus longissimus]|uniref:uncharacterized protein LOC135485723 n=1 Tax=Lineus longissimus TaxID=88925 RepID=UPI002B4D20E7